VLSRPVIASLAGVCIATAAVPQEGADTAPPPAPTAPNAPTAQTGAGTSRAGAETAIAPDMVEEWRDRYAALEDRRASLEQAHAPATAQQLARLDTARAKARSSAEIRDFVARSLTWYADRMAEAPAGEALELPPGPATLDVAMVRFELQFTPETPDGRLGTQRQAGEAGLQVARVGRPAQALLWLPELGFTLVPSRYVTPFVAPADGDPGLKPLEVGQ